MKKFIKHKLWPVIGGLLSAFIVMMIFEYVNSFSFPLPKDLNINNIGDLHAFTATLPWTAYILVLLGWIVGSFKAGFVTTYLSGEKKYKLSAIVGVVLVVCGILNNIMLGMSSIFHVFSTLIFIIFTYLGHKYMLKTRVRWYKKIF